MHELAHNILKRHEETTGSEEKERNFLCGASSFLLSNLIETAVTSSCIWVKEQVKTMNNIAGGINDTGTSFSV
jgi:hypothetical protein